MLVGTFTRLFFAIKPTRCTNFTNLFCHETLRVSDSSSVHHQEFIHCTLSNGICHTAFEQDQDGTEIPSWSCSKAVYKPVQWINSWWWTDKLSETCRVSWQNKFVKFMHLVGFIIMKFVTMHGHMNVKKTFTRHCLVRLHPSTMTTERWPCHYLALILNLFTVEQNRVSEHSECRDAGWKVPYLWIVWHCRADSECSLSCRFFHTSMDSTMLQKLQLKLMWRTIWSRLVFRILCECLQIACYKSVLVCVCVCVCVIY